MFFVGAGCYVMRDAIQLHGGLFWAMLAALLLAVAVNEHLFFVVYMLTLPFVVLYLAYRPAGSIRAYNKVGDYSFGLYIYAFPVQQAISALVPDVSVLSLLILSGVSTMLFAALSWHLVEQPCLRLKSVVGKVPMPALAPVVDAAWAGAGGRGRGHG
jgi:peptidoglycan/LPS O-acetylase OafA/YrhL